MHKLITIDLSDADVQRFEAYEQQVVPLLADHGASLASAVRTTDQKTEFHIVQFPDDDALQRFLADPRRLALQADWQRSGASATLADVNAMDYR